MDDASRTTHDTTHRPGNTVRWPVLARLNDVSNSSPALPSTGQVSRGGTNYRFDPPQATEAKNQSAIYRDIRGGAATTHIHSGTKSLRQNQPHVFDRGHAGTQFTTHSRGQSPILPSSNPFAIPRRRMVDSLAPALRFATMVALFTAASIWFQMMSRRGESSTEHMELPKTASQPLVAPTKSAADQPVPPSTASGPLESNSQSGARVGRAKGDDFATGGKSAAVVCPPEHPAATPPHCLIMGSGPLPRVQVAELPKVNSDEPAANAGDGEQAADAEEAAAVARNPGFLFEIPTR